MLAPAPIFAGIWILLAAMQAAGLADFADPQLVAGGLV
jgi:hypothetical protein